MSVKKSERLGEVAFNLNGDEMEIIEYVNNKHVMVCFPYNKGEVKKTTYLKFKQGKVYPFHKREEIITNDTYRKLKYVAVTIAIIAFLCGVFALI